MADYLATDAELKSIADAIRTKGGTSEALSYPDGFVSAIEGISGGGGSGIQMQQITVELDADQIWLPLGELTEIPEILIISSYDPSIYTSTERLPGAVEKSAQANKICFGCIPILPIRQYSSNTGASLIPEQNLMLWENITSMIEGKSNYYAGSYALARAQGFNVGWKYASEVTAELWQSAFAVAVAAAGYALGSSGELVFRARSADESSPTMVFGTGITYTLTALYGVIPASQPGYIAFDRSINSTNVTETVDTSTTTAISAVSETEEASYETLKYQLGTIEEVYA